jgi:hypothetical protein
MDTRRSRLAAKCCDIIDDTVPAVEEGEVPCVKLGSETSRLVAVFPVRSGPSSEKSGALFMIDVVPFVTKKSNEATSDSRARGRD